MSQRSPLRCVLLLVPLLLMSVCDTKAQLLPDGVHSVLPGAVATTQRITFDLTRFTRLFSHSRNANIRAAFMPAWITTAQTYW